MSTELLGYEAFKTLTALKLHFKKDSKYDIFANEGKVSAKFESFQKKNDRYFYIKLAKEYPDIEDLVWFCIANVLENPKIWIGELLKPEAKQIYLKKAGLINRLSYIFREDWETIVNEANKNKISLLDVFKILNNEQYPLIVNLVLSNRINIESYIILNEILQFESDIDKILDDPYIYGNLKWKCEKYKPFIMDINMDVFKGIFKEILIYLNEKPVDNTKQ